MVKGRNTTFRGVRISDELDQKIRQRAKEKGLSISDYLRECLEYITSHSENKTLSLQSTPSHIITPEELKASRQKSEDIPLYNPAIHRPGDEVLIKRGKKLVPMVVPELDADGNAIP